MPVPNDIAKAIDVAWDNAVNAPGGGKRGARRVMWSNYELQVEVHIEDLYMDAPVILVSVRDIVSGG